jgi:hypothetical protein
MQTAIDIDKDKENACIAVKQLIDKYAGDEYMYQKVNNYICNQLVSIFENMNESHKNRVTRITELTCEQDAFIQTFLNNNQYFYAAATDNFFYYDGLRYQLFNEDDILHQVLSLISRDGALMSWKQKTKLNIMKRIRETSLLQSIPESATIQSVIDSLCPLLFSTRAETKHFLTVLGDNIFRKHSSLIYFVDPDAKFFITQLNHMCQMFIGCNLMQTFKYKYHDHKYEDCRLIKINSNVKNDTTWSQLLNHNVLDVICVACHYSLRYNSADEYLTNYCNDLVLPQYVFYMKNMKLDTLLDEFVNVVIDRDEKHQQSNLTTTQVLPVLNNPTHMRVTQITWKNMQYLWKQYLCDKDLPAVVFLQTLKTMLVERLAPHYNAELDSFIGVCSKMLPAIHTFLNFWEDTMIEDDVETDLEIEEVVILFRKWCEQKNEMVSHLTDKQMLDIIAYYYPSLEIERDKFIARIRCTLWDKQLDIQIALDDMKLYLQNEYLNNNDSPHSRVSSPAIYRNISVYDAYTYYCKYISTPSVPPLMTSRRRQIVSKAYFEKYIFDNYQEYIIDSKFISCDWYVRR